MNIMLAINKVTIIFNVAIINIERMLNVSILSKMVSKSKIQNCLDWKEIKRRIYDLSSRRL